VTAVLGTEIERIARRWWTDADQAELDLLIHEFARAAALHHERCSSCREAGRWCSALSDACEALLEWREGRLLRSRAEYLRSGQDLVDFGRRLGYTPEQVRELQAKWQAEEAAYLEPEMAAA